MKIRKKREKKKRKVAATVTLPLLRRRLESKVDHERARTPRVCPPVRVRSGALAFLTSQTCSEGSWSSSEAVMIWVGRSGFQATATQICLLVGLISAIASLLFFKSQMTVYPFEEEEARMCGTCLFHPTHVTSTNF